MTCGLANIGSESKIQSEHHSRSSQRLHVNSELPQAMVAARADPVGLNATQRKMNKGGHVSNKINFVLIHRDSRTRSPGTRIREKASLLVPIICQCVRIHWLSTQSLPKSMRPQLQSPCPFLPHAGENQTMCSPPSTLNSSWSRSLHLPRL